MKLRSVKPPSGRNTPAIAASPERKPRVSNLSKGKLSKTKSSKTKSSAIKQTKIKPAKKKKTSPHPRLKMLRIHINEGEQFIRYESIVYLQAMGNYTLFHLDGNHEVTSTKNLGHYWNELPGNMFERIHRSSIVSISKIERLIEYNDKWILYLTEGNPQPVSREGKKLLDSRCLH